MTAATDLSTCDECDCESPVFYHENGKHLCGRHMLGCLCAKYGWDSTPPNRHHSRCPLAPPPCSICGGLIHTTAECSMGEPMPTCIFCGEDGHWSMACPFPSPDPESAS